MDQSENKRLKLIRKTLGYNQKNFAPTIGLTQGGYSDIERGKNGLSGKVKLMLVNVHKVNLNYLEKNQGGMFYIDTPPDEPEVETLNLDLGSTLDKKDRTIEILKADIKRLNAERQLYLDLLATKDKAIAALERSLKK